MTNAGVEDTSRPNSLAQDKFVTDTIITATHSRHNLTSSLDSTGVRSMRLDSIRHRFVADILIFLASILLLLLNQIANVNRLIEVH